jgi:hypothetical protein
MDFDQLKADMRSAELAAQYYFRELGTPFLYSPVYPAFTGSLEPSNSRK